MTLDLIGSAGVGKLDDDWLGCPWLKWIAPLEGGEFTLGDSGIPGFDVGTLVDLCLFVGRVRRSRPAVAIGDFLSPDQCSIVSWGSVMAWSWTSTVGAGVFLSVAVSYCNPCM